jgi:hypothetical protein
MGVKVYERIGFRLTSAKINRFLWRNESAPPIGGSEARKALE